MARVPLSVITLPAALLMFALSGWQFARMREKTTLAEERAARAEDPALILSTSDGWKGVALAELIFRPVRVVGRILPEKTMRLLASHPLRGPGVRRITPVALEGEGYVLVDLGFTPFTHEDTAPEDAGPVQIDGWVRQPTRAGFFDPEPDTRENLWFRVDVPAMAAYAGLSPVAPFLVAQEKGEPRLTSSRHLSYALTWLALGIAILAMQLIRRVHIKRQMASETERVA